MLGVTIATACLSVYLYVVVPKGFFPQQDTGLLTGNIQVPPDVSFAVANDKLLQYLAIIRADPAVQNVGGSASSGGYGGNLNIQLKPVEERRCRPIRLLRGFGRRPRRLQGRSYSYNRHKTSVWAAARPIRSFNTVFKPRPWKTLKNGEPQSWKN